MFREMLERICMSKKEGMVVYFPVFWNSNCYYLSSEQRKGGLRVTVGLKQQLHGSPLGQTVKLC